MKEEFSAFHAIKKNEKESHIPTSAAASAAAAVCIDILSGV